MIGQDVRTGKIEMSEYGNNRPQVAAYDTIQTAPRQQAETEKNFDPGDRRNLRAAVRTD